MSLQVVHKGGTFGQALSTVSITWYSQSCVTHKLSCLLELVCLIVKDRLGITRIKLIKNHRTLNLTSYKMWHKLSNVVKAVTFTMKQILDKVWSVCSNTINIQALYWFKDILPNSQYSKCILDAQTNNLLLGDFFF